MSKENLLVAVLLLSWACQSEAFFLFFPIPNLAKPAALQSTIDALEKSDQTRALAYVSEDKTFGAKMWVWGQYAGYVTLQEANTRALQQCEASLVRAKGQSAGGQPLYDFGNKRCELHAFSPNNAPIPPSQPVATPVPSEQPAPQLPAATPTAATPSPSGASDGDSTTMKKLRELKSAFDQGLITQEEYDAKRKAILENM